MDQLTPLALPRPSPTFRRRCCGLTLLLLGVPAAPSAGEELRSEFPEAEAVIDEPEFWEPAEEPAPEPAEPRARGDRIPAAAPTTAPAPAAAPAPAPAAAPAPATAPAPAPVVEPARPASPVTATVSTAEGLTLRSADDRFVLRPSGRLQFLYTFSCRDAGDDPCRESFSLPRARLGLAGHAHGRWAYKLTFDLGQGDALLKDFYLDAPLLPGGLLLRVGQWKLPFSRQQMADDARYETVTVSPVDSFSGVGRDIGLALHNGYEQSPPVELVAGIFNGTGADPWFSGTAAALPGDRTGEHLDVERSNQPERYHPALLLRTGYNHGDVRGYAGGSDPERGPLRFAIGVSSWLDLDADRDEAAIWHGELDVLVKVRGFAASGGLYLLTSRPGNGLADIDHLGTGYFGQLGYLLTRQLGVSARYTFLDRDTDLADEEETLLGVSWYPVGHRIKWQTDLRVLGQETTDGIRRDWGVLSQLQLAF